MNTEALKEQARRHEQREEWLKAIEMYGKAVDQLANDDQPDLSLYNRLGDLEIRVGNIERAVEHYEQAIELYVESELPNNAIAICRKVVRNLPTRHSTFLRMGQIRARQGFFTDARTNFLEYAERMQKAEDMEEAFRALIEFVDLAPEDIEARTALATQLEAHGRGPEAVEQYVAIHQRLTSKERHDEAEEIAAKIRELDPTVVIPPPRAASPLPPLSGGDDGMLGFETTSLVSDFPTLETAPETPSRVSEVDPGTLEIESGLSDDEGEGLEAPADVPPEDASMSLEPELAVADEWSDERTEGVDGTSISFGEVPEDVGLDDVSDDLPLEHYADATDELDAVAPTAVQEPHSAELDELPDPDAMEFGEHEVENEDLEASQVEPLPLITFEDDDEEPTKPADFGLAAADFGVRDDEGRDQEYLEPVGDIPDLDAELGDVGLGVPSEADEPGLEPDAADGLIQALQAQLEKDPDDADTWLALAQEFYGRGRHEEAGLAVGQALERFAATDDLDGSLRAVKTLVANQPDRLEHRQRLVELAIRKNDTAVLTSAYLDLAECLIRNGDEDSARAVYQQVLVADPENAAAAEALGGMAEAPAAPANEVASSEDYVDLGSLVLDGAEEKSTRWRVAAAEPSGDDEADFAKMLEQFKEKVAENLDADDLAAHYDLGTAYKEMGLVDEAIFEFQQALRAESNHLPTHELLGQCFIDKGQFEVAVRSMNRALDSVREVEDEFLGIYYQMARAHEELGNKGDALEFYEKVFALDINFQDVTERLRALR